MALKTRVFPVRMPSVARSKVTREGPRRDLKNGFKPIYMRMTGSGIVITKLILVIAIFAEKDVKYFSF